jgi:hypothetical protein
MSVHCLVGLCLAILSVNMLYFNPPLLLFLTTLFPLSFKYKFSICFIVSFSYTDVIYFSFIHALSFFSFFPPPLVSSNSPVFGNMLCVYKCIYENACIYNWICLPHMRKNMWPLSFWTWLTLVNMIFSTSIHLLVKDKTSFFFITELYSIVLCLIYLSIDHLSI